MQEAAQGARSQILQALGIGGHRSSPHEGSKPRFTHPTDPAQDRPSKIAAALAWGQRTGKPVPPHLRFRSPAQPAVPLGIRQRAAEYIDGGEPLAKATVAGLLADGRLTPARRRRLRRKAGHNGELPAGHASPRQPRSRAPRTPAQLRRAEKNARQQARHAARVIAAASMATVREWDRPDATPLADIAAIGRQPSGLS